MGREAYCWLSGGQNVGSFLRGDALVNGCRLWVIHGVCRADPLQQREVRHLQDRVMGEDVVLVQYHLVLMLPLPFARCACLSASCSVYWNVIPPL